MKIAIYGGSFNPMHIGHEKIVDYVLKNLDMDKIIIIPYNFSKFLNFLMNPLL